MEFSTDIIFFNIFSLYKTRFEQSNFAPIFNLIAFLRRSKMISSACLPRNCRTTANSSLQMAKKRKNHRFAEKPPKLPFGRLRSHLRESAFAPLRKCYIFQANRVFQKRSGLLHKLRKGNFYHRISVLSPMPRLFQNFENAIFSKQIAFSEKVKLVAKTSKINFHCGISVLSPLSRPSKEKVGFVTYTSKMHFYHRLS